ncbi:anti-repressor SinI family protein [Neobacillus sp. DY30]|uniref:anti-repressor SinI family protein n=1 Tax=Neobacillus sp. DY30 TaxID=3047871 RepID=UPI0024C0A432|nr:anti-repressor SinI family protein [Neobacillus sp. DY30]WHY00352.1 anti-repressor SinI family protein [Neobacillus sp. DY30]
MTTTIMEQDSKTPFDDEWKKLISYAKISGLTKEDILQFLQKNSTNELCKKI